MENILKPIGLAVFIGIVIGMIAGVPLASSDLQPGGIPLCGWVIGSLFLSCFAVFPFATGFTGRVQRRACIAEALLMATQIGICLTAHPPH